MRAVWWLLKALARATARLAQRVRPVAPLDAGDAFECLHGASWPALEGPTAEMGGQLDGVPRANLVDWLSGQPAEVVAELRELAGAYARTFCGKCEGGPDRPEARCNDCLDLLLEVVKGQGAVLDRGELSRWNKIAELARRGAL